MVAPIGGIGAFDAMGQVGGATSPSAGLNKSNGVDFASMLDNVQEQQDSASELLSKAMTGDLADVHDYMIAATQAQTSLELATSIRNRAVDAFNEIMRMQI
ncbi:MAG: flagellar hook-basal body complex protein FliE [Acidimicrobiia bacterium]